MKAFALFLVLTTGGHAYAQPPAPPAPATVEQLRAKLADVKKARADLDAKRADLDKQESQILADLRAKLKELQDLLGIIPAPPKPPEPKPADPLRDKLAAAYSAAAGTADQKREWAKDLAALYRAAAKLANDPSVTTAAALKSKLTAAAGALVGDGALVEVRKAVAGELAQILTADADLTADQRAATAALFARLASMLEAIAQ